MNLLVAKNRKSENFQLLVSHSLAVAHISRHIATDVLSLDPVLCEASFLAGLLHDIGKAECPFQDHVGGTGENDEGAKYKGPRHHEVSWAFIIQSRILPGEYQDIVASAVYWHHAQPVEYTEEGKVPLRGHICGIPLEEDSYKQILGVLGELGKHCPTLMPHTFQEADRSPPKLHGLMITPRADPTFKVANQIAMVRTCLIAADRFVSGHYHERDADFQYLVTGVIPDGARAFFAHKEFPAKPVSRPQHFSADRWDIQQGCIDRILGEQKPVAVVNAPAGFGKTSLGLRVALARGRQMLWVCPRNVVVESVSRGLQEEMEALGVTLSVETILGSQRVNELSSGVADTDPLFSGDIVVTNLDNLLKPCVSNSWAPNLHRVYSADMAFDEFHEFPETGGLFPLFIQTMQIRAQITKAKTLMLSATSHSVAPSLWDVGVGRDTDGRHTVFLPSRFRHYPAAHGDPYTLQCASTPPTKLEPGELYKTNAIRTAQEYDGATHLCHSAYFPDDRKDLMDFLFREFGKGGPRLASLTAPPIVQASLNISFSGGGCVASSAENDLQVLGRVNRFGDRPQGTAFSFYMEKSKSEESALSMKGLLYKDTTDSAHGLWTGFLRQEFSNPTTLTLDELYTKYNLFAQGISKTTLESNVKQMKDGCESVGKIFPSATLSNKTSRSPSKGNLRSPDGSYFIAVRDSSGVFGGPDQILSVERYEIEELVMENAPLYTNRNLVSRVIPSLTTSFPEWGSLLRGFKMAKDDKVNLVRLLNLARYKETPFPCPESYCYDRVQDESMRAAGLLGKGLVKKK